MLRSVIPTAAAMSAQPDVGIVGHAQQDMGVVREEVPARSLAVSLSRNLLNNS